MKWFREYSREMPWRGSEDPYRIWVSEMMLQQTQVGTVRKYYSRWIERFPDIFSLADASLEEVLKIWEGLGYYTRARNFHKGAKYIAENISSYGKNFPDNYEDWLKVPGVGPYTAAAVSSIAFGYPAGVLDANVLRVMSRLFCTDINTGSQAVKRELFERISRSFYEYHPGWVNQAWMELGSLQCKKNAVCISCPLKEMCCAYRKQEVDHYPGKKEKKPVPTRHGAAFIISRGSRTLMVRRRPEGFLGGLWEYPGYTLKKESADPQYLDSFLKDNYLEIIKKLETPVRHTYSHFIQHIDLYCANVKRKWENGYWDKARWVNTEDIRSLPRSGLAIKIGKITEAL